MRGLGITARLTGALGALVVLVTVLPVDELWMRLTMGPWNDSKGDVLVVLGADALEDVIGYHSYWRSVYAARAWHQGGFRRVIVSGGKTGSGPAVAEQMRDFLICLGVPAAAITAESASRSTRENATFTSKLLKPEMGRVVLLTSEFHMFRASRVFRKLGIRVETRPIPDGLKRAGRLELRWPMFTELCVESVKTVYYLLRGWI